MARVAAHSGREDLQLESEGLLDHPTMFASFPMNLVPWLASGEMRATPAQLETFRAFADKGDPLADAVVEEMRACPGGAGRRLCEQALGKGIDNVPDAGPALRALFQEVESVPCWLDQAKLKLGAETIQRTGLLGAYGALVDVSLMGGYLSRRALKTLVRTGEIGDKAPRRIAETALWWMSVTDTGGMARHADGFKNTLRVRLTHAQVRAAMNRAKDWNYADWDAPVNQPQMAGTQLLFSLIGLLGMRVMGFRFTPEETDAVIHLWRYVGFLIGVDRDLLPASEADAWRLMWLLAATEFQPDEDSRKLATALSAALPPLHGLQGEGRLARWAAGNIIRAHNSLSRLVLGKDNGDRLGLVSSMPLTAGIVAAAGMMFGVETCRRVLPGATRVSVKAGNWSRRLAMERMAPPLKPDMSFTREH
jgi:hypothetical protein